MELAYFLIGPISARDLGEGRSTTVCGDCGRGTTVRQGPLKVELLMQTEGVWFTDSNAVLLSREVGETLGLNEELGEVCLDQGGAHSIFELVPRKQVSASPLSVRDRCATCGAMGHVSFSPLRLENPLPDGLQVARLRESSELVLFSPTVMEALKAHSPGLAFEAAFGEAERSQDTEWSDF